MSEALKASITDLQMRIAYQDETIEQINAVVVRHEQEIQHLQTELAELRRHVQELRDAQPAAGQGMEKPPHY